MNVFDTIAEILQQEGIEYLFAFPNTPLIDGCAARDIRPIICRQERVGVGMADGFSRVADGRRVGVFAMQAGPGAENAFPGVACAYADSTPILVLPMGQTVAHAQVRPYFSSANAYGSVTKSLEVVTAPSQTVDVMRRAFSQLRNGPSGPVMVEVPRDVGAMDVPGLVEGYRPVRESRSAGSTVEQIEAAAAALVAAKDPLIYVGQGALYAGATKALRTLAEILDVPVVTSLGGMSAFPGEHPLSLGMASVTMGTPALRFMQRADFVLAIGASLTHGDLTADLPAGKVIAHVTNNPADLNKSYFADQPLLGDARLVTEQLLEACAERLEGGRSDRRVVREEIRALRDAWLAEWMPILTSDEVPITPYRVIWDLMQAVDPAEAIVTHDCGSPRNQITPFYRPGPPRSYLGWGKSHALGTGLSLILGAKLAAPDKLCVCVMGDAAFGMTGLDLETAVRSKIPVLAIVMNNSHMASESGNIIVSHEKYSSRDLGGDHAEIARGLGLEAERVERPKDIIPALGRAREAIEDGRPALVEVMTSRETRLSHFGALSSLGDFRAPDRRRDEQVDRDQRVGAAVEAEV